MRARAIGRLLLAISVALAAWLTEAEARAASCSFVSIDPVIFGTYNVFDPWPLDSTGSITFACSGLGPSDPIVLELSSGWASSALDRRMMQGSDPLHYNVYLDAARSLVWGNGTGGSSTYGPVVVTNGVNHTQIIFGRIPARQNVSLGMYADTVIATILF